MHEHITNLLSELPAVGRHCFVIMTCHYHVTFPRYISLFTTHDYVFSGNRFAGFGQIEVCFDGVGSQVRRVSALKDGMQPFTETHLHVHVHVEYAVDTRTCTQLCLAVYM